MPYRVHELSKEVRTRLESLLESVSGDSVRLLRLASYFPDEDRIYLRSKRPLDVLESVPNHVIENLDSLCVELCDGREALVMGGRVFEEDVEGVLMGGGIDD